MILDRHRVYIFPTRQGIVFIMVLIAMLAGSINYNNNLGFMLVFLLGGISLVSMIHTYRNILGLQVLSVNAAGPVFAGHDAVFHISVRTGRHARKAIFVSADNRQSASKDYSANAHETVSAAVPTIRRGRLRPGSFTMSTVYPLGLFSAWTVFWPEKDYIVYPAPKIGAMIRSDPHPGKIDRKQGFISGAEDYSGLKPYQPGDSFRHIAWKALSRGQGVFTKDFDGAARRSAISFDFKKIPANDTEARLSKLCGMILQASRENMQYGLVLPGKEISPGSGDAHMHQCLRALAVFTEDDSNG